MAKRLFHLLLTLFTIVVIVGCGGGGGGGITPSAPTTKVSAFSTDDLNAGYDHVWVTIKAINLIGSTGPVALFSETPGRTVDLKTLRDASGERFMFMNSRSIPSGTYSGVSVVVDNSASIIPSGSATAISATFQTSGDFTMSLTFASPVVVSGSTADICVDFKLSNWVLTGSTITAPSGFLAQGRTDTLRDGSRHEPSEFVGIVTSLSGAIGSQTFNLGSTNDAPSVITTANTAIFFNNGAANPALENGQKVEVRGVLNPTTRQITASRITIQVEQHSNQAAVQGLVLSSSDPSGTVEIKIAEARGFVPKGTSLVIDVSDSTHYFGNHGTVVSRASFMSALTTTTHVAAEGSIDSASGHLVARSIKLADGEEGGGGNDGNGGGTEGGGGHGDGAIIIGAESAFVPTETHFTVTVRDWELITTSVGTKFTVRYNASTLWFRHDQPVSLSTLTDRLQAGAPVLAKGTLDPANPNVLNANSLIVLDN